MKILVCDYDDSTRTSIALMFRSNGDVVETAGSDEEAEDFLSSLEFDLAIISMPTIAITAALIGRLRRDKVLTPIIGLVIEHGIDARVKALSTGADDVMTRPFHKDELVARALAVCRRSRGLASSVIHIQLLSIDTQTHAVAWDGAAIHLTERETSLLEFLAIRRGQIVTKEAILSRLYEERDEPDQKIVDVFICKLRKKLSDAGAGTNFIHTMWGRGYMIPAATRLAA